MKTINCGIFHDSSGELLALLGKKGTMTNIQFSNRKDGDDFFNFLQPREDKLAAKCQIIHTVDTAILAVDEITPQLGETILLLDAVGMKNGIIIISDYVDRSTLKKISKGTVVAGYKETEKDFNKIMDALNSFEIPHDTEGKKVVEIDQFFNVRGVGTVILGFVKQGTLKKFDKLKMYPGGKEITVRSIQMQDKDFDEAPAGCRVGLALKGVDVDEFTKGTILAEEGATEFTDELSLEFSENNFYQGAISEGNTLHFSYGFLLVPCTIKSAEKNKLDIKFDRKIPFRKNEKALILDLNAPKLHLVGSGIIS